MIFQYILRMIRNGWKIILAFILFGIVVSLIISLNTLPLYRSEATFIIAPNASLPSSHDVVDALAALDTLKIFSTYSDVIISQRVYDASLKSINLTAADLIQYQRSTFMRSNSIILTLYVDGPDPALAAKLANTIGQKGIDFINAYYTVFQINFLDQAVESTKPLTPQPLKNGLIAAGIGLLSGLLIAIFRDQLQAPLSSFLQAIQMDHQSGAYTHKYFIRLLEREVLENKTDVFSLALIEMEGLKDLVDVLPDFALTDILQQVTNLLRNQLRGNDIIGRWDKLSFALLLPGTPQEAAHHTINRLKKALSQSIKFGANHSESTELLPSVGLTTRTDQENVQRIISIVEAALKRAKDASYEPMIDENKK